MAKKRRRTGERKKGTEPSPRQVIRIDVPDDVLLKIFHFYTDSRKTKTGIEGWQSLVHVCRQWRNLVFASLRRLNLRLYCTPKTPARDLLGIWPALPLIVEMDYSSTTDNVIAALEQSNRVRHVRLVLPDSQLEEVLAPMRVPFPKLTYLELSSGDETLPVLPDSFLDGSAPGLLHFKLDGIPFPGLPKLLLSATHLVNLSLLNIPLSGYLSPESIVTPLAVLSSLRTLRLHDHFQSFDSRPDRETRCSPPSKRSAIPALTSFHFQGATEYLEDLVTFIDAPRLYDFYISFFNEINFDTPRLGQFISRTPRLMAHDKARVQFYDAGTSVALLAGSTRILEIEIPRGDQYSQLLDIAEVSSSLPPVSTVEVLYIEYEYWELGADVPWLDLLRPFSAVKNLHLPREFEPGITTALQESVESGITEVLPNLQNTFVEEL